jgi:hypothetical protein
MWTMHSLIDARQICLRVFNLHRFSVLRGFGSHLPGGPWRMEAVKCRCQVCCFGIFFEGLVRHVLQTRNYTHRSIYYTYVCIYIYILIYIHIILDR